MANSSISGYTILETLIVMAVTTSMFLIVASTFSGRQQQVQFAQAVRNFDSKLIDISNDVASGYFPANEGTGCRAVGNGPMRRPQYSGPVTDLGTNEQCVSIGKVIQISPDVNDSNNDDRQYVRVYNIAGLRSIAGGDNPTNLVDSRPTADPNFEQILLEWGLKITRVISSQSPSVNNRGGMAVFSDINRSSSLNSSSSNEQVQINIVPGTDFGMTEAQFIGEINNLNDKIASGSVDFDSNPTITICVSDNDENRRAKILFSSNQSGNIIEFDDIGECIP